MKKKPFYKDESGFSLFEMAMCLAIIGFVGGAALMLGGNLLEKARLQKVVAQIQEIQQAILSYQEIYDKFPDFISSEEKISPVWSELIKANLLAPLDSTSLGYPSKIGGVFTIKGGELLDPKDNKVWLVLQNEKGKALLTPQQALYLDKKLSNGNPTLGQVRALKNELCFKDQNYNLEHTGPACILYIELAQLQ